MKGKLTALAMAGAFAAGLFATAAMAGAGGNGNGAPAGPHYNLNIIGVEKAKGPKMTGSNRHTIFVPLVSTKSGQYSKTQFDSNGDPVPGTAIVDSKIWLTPGADFQVCDGNGFDAAYDGCDSGFAEYWGATRGVDYYDVNGDYLGTVVNERKDGAVFMLPCNQNISQDADNTYNCDTSGGTPYAHYGVWAKANGAPGGTATMTTCADVSGELVCSLENSVLTSTKGKNANVGYTEVTDELTSLLNSLCDGIIEDDGTCTGTVVTERYALFSGDTYDWFWNYDNNGLRLAQLRFYLSENIK